MARLPEPAALLGLGRPSAKSPPPCSAAIARTVSACSSTPASVPWNSKNSVGCSRQVELGVRLTASHLHVVEQLDARDRDAGLDRLDHGVDRALEVAKGADRRRDRFRDAVQPQLTSVMMPSVPSEPTNSRVRS